MSQPISHFFTHDGVKLHYLQQGQGEPILLLHGITDNGACWGRTADALAQNYTVYALDQRGHGSSEAPPGRLTYPDYVSDAYELLRANNLSGAIVMGHSFGGMVGLALAASHPDAVTKLILVDPPLFDIDPNAGQEQLDQRRTDFFEWLRDFQKLDSATLEQICHTNSPNWSDAECEAWADSKLHASERLWQHDGIPQRSDWRIWLTQVHCPTLLVYGDPALRGIIDDAKAAEVLTLLQNGQAVQIPDAGHSVHRDQFEPFIHVVNSFL